MEYYFISKIIITKYNSILTIWTPVEKCLLLPQTSWFIVGFKWKKKTTRECRNGKTLVHIEEKEEKTNPKLKESDTLNSRINSKVTENK